MSLWLLGGVDPTGGAGLARDRWAAMEVAPSLEITAVATAMTEQGDGRPARAQPVDPQVLARALAEIEGASAVKLGLVPEVVVGPVLAGLTRVRAPRVLDPVLRASDGGSMGASPTGLRALFRAIDLLTPNRDEAIALLEPGDDPDDAGAILARRHAPMAVLLKDGHGHDRERVRDRLFVAGRELVFDRPRQHGDDPRGTGCALATAIACGLASGASMDEACARAIAWLDRARRDTVIGPDGRAHLRSRS